MDLALRREHMIALLVLVLLTVLVASTIVFSTVEHINVWHLLSRVVPHGMYGGF